MNKRREPRLHSTRLQHMRLSFISAIIIALSLTVACEGEDARFTNVPDDWLYDRCDHVETQRLGRPVKVNNFCAESRRVVLGCDRGEPRYEMTPTCFIFEEPRLGQAYLFVTPARFPFPDDPRWTEYADGVECRRALQQECPEEESDTP